MVVTRASARQSSNQEEVVEDTDMAEDTDMDLSDKQVEEVGQILDSVANDETIESNESVESNEPIESNTTVESNEATEAVNSTKREEIKPTRTPYTLSGFMKGFTIRVIICSLLVMLAKNVWPELQSRFWPEEPLKEGKLYILNDKSFRGHIRSGDHFVMMYAPWCGHCKALKPTWEKIAKSPGVKGVQISKFDCTANERTCKEYDVTGYPTLLYFRNGKMIETYNGQKTETELKKYLKTMNVDKKTMTSEQKTNSEKKTGSGKKTSSEKKDKKKKIPKDEI